jgi:hypothetical protein
MIVVIVMEHVGSGNVVFREVTETPLLHVLPMLHHIIHSDYKRNFHIN